MFEDVAARFNDYSLVLKAFEKKHNLLTEKFLHDGEAWFFKYRRKDKGYCQIQVLITSDKKITLFGF